MTLFPDLDADLAAKRAERTKKRAKSRAYYEANRERSIESTKASTKRRRAALKTIVDEFKQQACVACGESYPTAAMQCHHRDPRTKAAAVATLVHRGVREEILRMELAKCDVVCANCHMIEHFGEGD
jgi:hypothetical protein